MASGKKPKAWVLGRGGPCPGKLIQQKALNGPALLQGNEHPYRVALVHREIGGVLALQGNLADQVALRGQYRDTASAVAGDVQVTIGAELHAIQTIIVKLVYEPFVVDVALWRYV